MDVDEDEDDGWGDEESWGGLHGPGTGGDEDIEMEPSADHAGSDSSAHTSGSDYEAARLLTESKRSKLKKRGKPYSDTEEEDEDEDAELQDDVVDESTPPRPARNPKRYYSKKHKAKLPQSPPRVRAGAKGKGRAVDKPADAIKGLNENRRRNGYGDGRKKGEDDGNGEDEGGDDGGGENGENGGDGEGGDGGGKKPVRGVRGRWPQAALEEVAEFGRQAFQKAEELAYKYGKDTSGVLLRSGLSIRMTRGPNFFNQFKQWFSQKYPDECCMCTFLLLLLVC